MAFRQDQAPFRHCQCPALPTTRTGAVRYTEFNNEALDARMGRHALFRSHSNSVRFIYDNRILAALLRDGYNWQHVSMIFSVRGLGECATDQDTDGMIFSKM